LKSCFQGSGQELKIIIVILSMVSSASKPSNLLAYNKVFQF
jgi:hypothetical protein